MRRGPAHSVGIQRLHSTLQSIYYVWGQEIASVSGPIESISSVAGDMVSVESFPLGGVASKQSETI